jgi:FliI/YscN family ATPase
MDCLTLKAGPNGCGLLRPQLDAMAHSATLGIEGRVGALAGLTIELLDFPQPVGALCQISMANGGTCLAEVIGFHGGRTLAMALTPPVGVSSGDKVETMLGGGQVWCSDELLGRVLDGFGNPQDGKPGMELGRPRPVEARGVGALNRVEIRQAISTSFRSIDALHTCGMGQRMGIFAGPGVGKSTLMGQIARYTSADVSVVALIGERGREVHDFVNQTIGPDGMKKCVIVASTGDDPPSLQIRAAKVACAVAEHFRDQGKNVLLLLDSLTRLAHAQRQIGLAAKEPPATRGYPPSVFSLIPKLLERAGRTPKGSITGFYTVLVEGDDFNEPIPDAVKGITDGHLLLTRTLAEKGHFPAINVGMSISRVRGDVSTKEHVNNARKVLALWALWNEIEDLVNLGAYQRGSNPEYDLAIEARPKIVTFLRQESMQPVTLAQAQKDLADLCTWIDHMDKLYKAQAAKRATSAPPAPAAGGK